MLGHLVTSAGVRLPGDIAYGLPFANMKTGLAAFETIPTSGIFQIIAFIGMIEIGFNSCEDQVAELCEQKYSALVDDRRKVLSLTLTLNPDDPNPDKSKIP
jgi:hypothetical protein